MASALATTTSIERENGVCVIDIGAQITEFIVYKGQQPCIMGTLPVGSQNFTYDLSSGLRIHSEDAKEDYVEEIHYWISEKDGVLTGVEFNGN